MAAIALQNVTKRYPNGQTATRTLSLDIADGELLVLVGPSGSGKSTVLRLIAGLEAVTSGRVFIDGVDVTKMPPQRRDLAMVFQSYALYPHKTVRENLAFGLRMRHVDPARIDARVQAAASILGIGDVLNRKPAQLSGGQRQRVALGRAIVREPKAFLLDEPLSNLDPALRVFTRTELALLHRRLAATMVYVTHDQEEAMTLGTRIAVMRDGALEQVAPALEVFRRPANVFVAQFVGSPAMNVWRCRARRDAGRLHLTSNGLSVAMDDDDGSIAAAEDILLGVRPHDVELVENESGDGGGFVEILEPLGAVTLAHIRPREGEGDLVRVVVPADAPLSMGAPVTFRLPPHRRHLFDVATGQRLACERQWSS